MSSFDLVVRNGLVVSSQRVERLDLGVTDGKIEAREPSLSAADAGRTIDATGKYVLPGAIDPHFHPQYGDNLEVGSVAAAYGGITTLVSFVYGGRHIKTGYEGVDLVEAFEEFAGGDGSRSTLDWAAHMGVLDPTTIDRIPDVQELGVQSFKFFMAYLRRGMMLNDEEFLTAMRLVRDGGGVTMVHAENGLAIDYLETRFRAEGKVEIDWFERSRPKYIEYEAVNRAIELARLVECPLYLVHQTTGEAVPMIERALDRGQHVIGETCPQYLLQTNDDLLEQGPQAVLTPPYRTDWDLDVLWDAIRRGVITTVGSDHSPHPKEKKETGNIFTSPVGTPQVETMLPLMFGKGVSDGLITLPQLVAILSENPARVFGLYPRKGSLDVGADADVCIIDPAAELQIDEAKMHSNVDYNTYHGWTVLGSPVHTLQRGQDVLVDGELRAEGGAGQFLATQQAPLATVSGGSSNEIAG